MSVLKIHNDNFRSEVLESEKVVLLDFYADWCGPCRMLGPVIDEIAAENPHIKVGKVNVDENMDLASQFKVVSIPLLVVIKNGEVVNKSLGVKAKEEILEMLK
jgi:thioredoxin 1